MTSQKSLFGNDDTATTPPDARAAAVELLRTGQRRSSHELHAVGEERPGELVDLLEAQGWTVERTRGSTRDGGPSHWYQCQPPTGEQLKQAGMERAAQSKESLLRYAQDLAVRIAEGRPDRCVTADDVQAALRAEGISQHALGNAAGSLFRGKRWQWTGRRVKSVRDVAHANELKVWRLVL